MKAWQLLDSREKWIQKDYGMDSRGNSVNERNPLACKWCIVGAIYRAYDSPFDRDIATEKARSYLNVNLLSSWNDKPERTYEEVHALLKELDI